MHRAGDSKSVNAAITTRSRPNVLLTGFGPFPGVAHNATGILVPILAEAAAHRFPDVTVHHAVLPTEWDSAPRLLDDLLAKLAPVLTVHFGVSKQARGFVVETVARNVTCASADMTGRVPDNACIVTDGPEQRAAGPGTGRILDALRAEGFAATLSDDAGAYLCNRVLYHTLGHPLCRGGTLHGYFVHLPSDLAGYGDDGMESAPDCPLDRSGAVAGGIVLLGTALNLIAKESPAGEDSARLRGHAGASRDCRTPDGR